MEPTNTLYSSILLLGAAHGLFLALALINVKSGNAIAHRILALLTLTFAADLGVDFLNESRYLIQVPKLYFVESVTSFLYGPLSYLYVIALTSKSRFKLSGRVWWHFLPFVMSIVLLIPFYTLNNAQVVELIYSDVDVVDALGLWVIAGIIVQLLPLPLIGIYLTLTVRRLIRHSRIIRNQFSSIERINLTWLRNLLIALGMLFLIYLFAAIFSDFFGIDEEKSESLLNIAVVIVIYTIGYMGLRQPVIFSQINTTSASNAEQLEISNRQSVAPERKKYEKSALDADTSRALLQELQRHMADESPYLDSALTLNQLADQLRMSSNYLSQVINEQTGNNFFDYINQYRVDAAKLLLADTSKTERNILTVAMDAGFNSKSAFYTAFKKHTSQTPTQFRTSLALKPDAN